VAHAGLFVIASACSDGGDSSRGASARELTGEVIDVSDLDGPVTVRTWLVAGPISNPDLAAPRGNWPDMAGFNKDLLSGSGGEAACRASVGTRVVAPDGREYAFARRTWNTGYIDLTELYGRRVNMSAYLYAEIESDREQRVYLHIGSNDAARIWVGGEPVLAIPTDRLAARSQNIVDVDLPAGRTPVLFRVDQDNNDWGAYFEVSDTFEPPDRRRYPIRNMPEEAIAIVAILTLFGGPIVGLVLIVWIWMRHSTDRELHRKEIILALTKTEVDPDVIRPALQAPASKKLHRMGMFVWGLVLALGGLGLTVVEIAHSGLGNAGFELFVMLSGVGLLISWRILSGDSHDAP